MPIVSVQQLNLNPSLRGNDLRRKRNRSPELSYEVNETLYLRESEMSDPESSLLRSTQNQLIAEAIENLPVEFREVIVLRELEELSYKEIAAVAGIPVGTVMSRLARARKKLRGSIPEEQLFGKTRTRSTHLAGSNEEAEALADSREQINGADSLQE